MELAIFGFWILDFGEFCFFRRALMEDTVMATISLVSAIRFFIWAAGMSSASMTSSIQ